MYKPRIERQQNNLAKFLGWVPQGGEMFAISGHSDKIYASDLSGARMVAEEQIESIPANYPARFSSPVTLTCRDSSHRRRVRPCIGVGASAV